MDKILNIYRFVFMLKSPIGLIYGLVAGAIFEVILSFILINPTPKFNFNMILFKEVINRGKKNTKLPAGITINATNSTDLKYAFLILVRSSFILTYTGNVAFTITSDTSVIGKREIR